MRRNKLNKNLLFRFITGDPHSEIIRDFSETEQISSMIYQQWNSPVESELVKYSDLKNIFAEIKKKTVQTASVHDNSKLLIREIEVLKTKNYSLKYRFQIFAAVAAVFLLLFLAGGMYMMKSFNPFEKTITESIAPLGQKSQMILADGTVVRLNSGTVLRYDNRFGKQNRRIEMTGEAFFEVAKNKKLPFTIYTSGIEIKVTGTKFNVMAYPEDPQVETSVTEGQVKVREINSEESYTLTANQKAYFIKDKKEIIVENNFPKNSISWKEDVLYFDNENFFSVVKKLERWYNVSISLEGKDSIDDRFTFTVKDESLREVLDLIKITTPLKYKFRGNHVTITYSNK